MAEESSIPLKLLDSYQNSGKNYISIRRGEELDTICLLTGKSYIFIGGNKCEKHSESIYKNTLALIQNSAPTLINSTQITEMVVTENPKTKSLDITSLLKDLPNLLYLKYPYLVNQTFFSILSVCCPKIEHLELENQCKSDFNEWGMAVWPYMTRLRCIRLRSFVDATACVCKTTVSDLTLEMYATAMHQCNHLHEILVCGCLNRQIMRRIVTRSNMDKKYKSFSCSHIKTIIYGSEKSRENNILAMTKYFINVTNLFLTYISADEELNLLKNLKYLKNLTLCLSSALSPESVELYAPFTDRLTFLDLSVPALKAKTLVLLGERSACLNTLVLQINLFLDLNDGLSSLQNKFTFPKLRSVEIISTSDNTEDFLQYMAMLTFNVEFVFISYLNAKPVITWSKLPKNVLWTNLKVLYLPPQYELSVRFVVDILNLFPKVCTLVVNKQFCPKLVKCLALTYANKQSRPLEIVDHKIFTPVPRLGHFVSTCAWAKYY